MALACELADDAEAAWRDLDNWTEIPRDLHDPEYEEYQFHAEEVERTTLSYRHALQRLWACGVRHLRLRCLTLALPSWRRGCQRRRRTASHARAVVVG